MDNLLWGSSRENINELNPQRGIKARSETGRVFAPAGQTTQMMIGSMGENDRTITVLADSPYRKYDLRRVYYSPFDASNHGGYKTPKWRGRRLYQADRLVKLYGTGRECADKKRKIRVAGQKNF